VSNFTFTFLFLLLFDCSLPIFFFFLCDVSDFAYIVRQYSLSNWISQVIFMSFVKFSVGFLLSKGRDDDAAGD